MSSWCTLCDFQECGPLAVHSCYCGHYRRDHVPEQPPRGRPRDVPPTAAQLEANKGKATISPHTEGFNKDLCPVCGKALGFESLLVTNGVKTHAECGGGKICAKCNGPVAGKYVGAGGLFYHKECAGLDSDCRVCNKPLSGNMANVQGGKVHSACLNCATCKKNVVLGFLQRQNEFYCGPCYNDKYSVVTVEEVVTYGDGDDGYYQEDAFAQYFRPHTAPAKSPSAAPSAAPSAPTIASLWAGLGNSSFIAPVPANKPAPKPAPSPSSSASPSANKVAPVASAVPSANTSSATGVSANPSTAPAATAAAKSPLNSPGKVAIPASFAANTSVKVPLSPATKPLPSPASKSFTAAKPSSVAPSSPSSPSSPSPSAAKAATPAASPAVKPATPSAATPSAASPASKPAEAKAASPAAPAWNALVSLEGKLKTATAKGDQKLAATLKEQLTTVTEQFTQTYDSALSRAEAGRASELRALKQQFDAANPGELLRQSLLAKLTKLMA